MLRSRLYWVWTRYCTQSKSGVRRLGSAGSTYTGILPSILDYFIVEPGSADRGPFSHETLLAMETEGRVNGQTILRERESGRQVRASSAGIGVERAAFVGEAETPVVTGRSFEVLFHRGVVFGLTSLVFNLVMLGWQKHIVDGIKRLEPISPWLLPLAMFFVAVTPSLLAISALVCGAILKRKQDGSGLWLVLLGLLMFLASMIAAVPASQSAYRAFQFLLEHGGKFR